MKTKKEKSISGAQINGEFVSFLGEDCYVIRNYDQMRPFLVSVVSSSDHWLFVSTTGGLSAGRKNADNALFPYYTEDKVADSAEQTGSVTVIRLQADDGQKIWQPFSIRQEGLYRVRRNIYKSIAGTKLYFEETNEDLQLTFRYGWTTSHTYGIVRHAQLLNTGGKRMVEVMDGIQNILPYGVDRQVQNEFSCLLDGYKKNELDPESGLGIYRLSSLLTDKAEPSEGLLCTTVWSTERNVRSYLLSTEQLDDFRNGYAVENETDIRARRGAYLIHFEDDLAGEKEWYITAEINQDHSALVELTEQIKTNPTICELLKADIARGTELLDRIVGSADGLQSTADRRASAHHYANVLFNVMRGGTYADGYNLPGTDFLSFVAERNSDVASRHRVLLTALPETIPVMFLKKQAAESGDPDLERLVYEYLPLFFSRRHGDPSRPWNTFSIDIYDENGADLLNYQGNWRDIFQNWEALSLSYPGFLANIVVKFLNATTADGFNPYRVTRWGIDWEVPEPSNPWSNIGYWKDHQIIYLLKLLEWMVHFNPEELTMLLDRPIFTHADVPYRLKPYDHMLRHNRDTIDFDYEYDAFIQKRVDTLGSDGRLMHDANGELVHVTMIEKLCILFLTKMTNFIPGGGIWLNTQRPEWNDANNALAGPGLSVVTLGYLRRFITFFRQIMADNSGSVFTVSEEVADLVVCVSDILTKFKPEDDVDPVMRRTVMDNLGRAGEAYRSSVYDGMSGNGRDISADTVLHLLDVSLEHVDATLRSNRRDDGLYHSYNLLVLQKDGSITVRNLYEMLEGQVSILSSGLLTPEDASSLVESLYASEMYREDQMSFMLYPDRTLQRFMEKNTIPPDKIASSLLVKLMVENGDTRIIKRDIKGAYHFNGQIKNAEVLEKRLTEVARDDKYTVLVEKDREMLSDLYEEIFDHNSFTGRSGTFFAYEGLGCIYWHQVAKLLLALQEQCLAAARSGSVQKETVDRLCALYYKVREGVGGFNKEPSVYGAFPLDPYSHTPKGKGAQQPGMTGQVKEEVITRLSEMGIALEKGAIRISPVLLRRREFLTESSSFSYYGTDGIRHTVELDGQSLAFTVCQVPFVYTIGDTWRITVRYTDGRTEDHAADTLPTEASRLILSRSGEIESVYITVHNVEIME